MESFCFKRFSVRQSKSAMKVNTDGVLLAAWVTLNKLTASQSSHLIENPLRILDIGTGTGVISLILAQRLESGPPFKITAIEIDKNSSEEAAHNFSESPWSNNLVSKNISLQCFMELEQPSKPEKFSLILSNPPYFTQSLKAPSTRRSIARHNDVLPLEDIVKAAHLFLEDDGILALVLPVNEGVQIISLAKQMSLNLARVCRVKTLIHKKEKRLLLEFTKGTCETVEQELIIQEKGGEFYSHAYCSLVENYYLKLFKTEDSA
ncbi:MAG: tRNA (adenine-N(6)-)-methyltransferase [Bacteroidetes bacterium HGW-Bacteroidetes-8]|jgi:tRNA1Val (adenine37-N6)-methyltransferase|nr:MAG: tRNA (adenine-N(6)-)-methyltransferase [Bacteroidetes bacterium HGW-Bacteroidetes-8]